jgi:hypothetical protein
MSAGFSRFNEIPAVIDGRYSQFIAVQTFFSILLKGLEGFAVRSAELVDMLSSGTVSVSGSARTAQLGGAVSKENQSRRARSDLEAASTLMCGGL